MLIYATLPKRAVIARVPLASYLAFTNLPLVFLLRNLNKLRYGDASSMPSLRVSGTYLIYQRVSFPLSKFSCSIVFKKPGGVLLAGAVLDLELRLDVLVALAAVEPGPLGRVGWLSQKYSWKARTYEATLFARNLFKSPSRPSIVKYCYQHCFIKEFIKMLFHCTLSPSTIKIRFPNIVNFPNW